MTIEPPAKSGRKALTLAGLGLGAVGVLVAVILSLRTPPQMGPDEGVFRAVDALYTAVRNRDDTQLTHCESRLHAARAAGTLPADSAAYLDGVIAKARGGGWESAAERLYDFMLVQRREGYTPAAKPEKKSKSVKNTGK